jgi:hypothetical protein
LNTIFATLYNQLKTGCQAVKLFLNRLPHYPPAVHEICSAKSYEIVFPVRAPLLFLYNFEILESERPASEIPRECLNYLVTNGFILPSVMAFFNRNWPLSVAPQTVFDRLIRFFQSSVAQPALILAAKIGSSSLNITAAQSQLISLLCSENQEIQIAARSFLETVTIPFEHYSHWIEKHPHALSSNFYLSLASKLTENNRSIATHLLTVVSNHKEPLNDGQLVCLSYFVQFSWFTAKELSIVSNAILDRFFRGKKPLPLCRSVVQLVSHLQTPEICTQFRTLFTKFTYDAWHTNGDHFELNFEGHVGLTNLGCTCFLNSILQQFFAVRAFRQLILHYSGSSPFVKNLRQLFASLSLSDAREQNTREVVKYWTGPDGEKLNVRVQQDASEFILSFFDKIESEVDPNPLFQGKTCYRVEDLTGTPVSEIIDTFTVLPLPVMNCPDIAKSLELFSHPDFISDYKIDGKPADVRGWSHVIAVPRHLIVQLKRFDFEYKTWTRRKIKTIFEFPINLNLKETDFVLQGVIVHRGSTEAGHYYSYIRENDDDWLCFNDTIVSRVTQQHVLEEGKKLAYILFYSQYNDDEVTVPDDLQKYVGEQNAIYHSQRILCSMRYFTIMESYATSQNPDFVGLALEYMFAVLPYSIFAEFSERIETELLRQLDSKINAFAKIASYVNHNVLICCPKEELRKSANNIVFEYLRRKADGVLLGKMVELIADCETNCESHNFFETWLRLFQAVPECKQFAIEAKFPGKVQAFVAKKWKATIGKGKRDISAVNLSPVLRLITLTPLSKSFRTQFLTENLLLRIFDTKTDLHAIAEVFRCFDNLPTIVSTLKSFSKKHPTEFDELIGILTSAS